MFLTRSTDYPLLNRLLRNAGGLYPFLGDDFALPLAECSVVEHSAICYILARDNEDILGFWMLAPDNGNTICWVLHTMMPLNARALIAMRELLGPDGWLWKHTPCLRVITAVPSSNPIALRFGLRAGLKQFSTNPNSYLKDGILRSQILLGASRP